MEGYDERLGYDILGFPFLDFPCFYFTAERSGFVMCIFFFTWSLGYTIHDRLCRLMTTG